MILNSLRNLITKLNSLRLLITTFSDLLQAKLYLSKPKQVIVLFPPM